MSYYISKLQEYLTNDSDDDIDDIDEATDVSDIADIKKSSDDMSKEREALYNETLKELGRVSREESKLKAQYKSGKVGAVTYGVEKLRIAKERRAIMKIYDDYCKRHL